MWKPGWNVLALAAVCAAGSGSPPPAAAQAAPPSRAAPATPLDSAAYQTRKDFAACTSREQLHELMTHVAEGAREAYRSMVTDPASGCFLLKPGLEVRPIGYNAAYVELQPAGMRGSIWTVLEAIEPKPRRERQDP